MPINIQADTEQKLVFTTCTGIITLEEIGHYLKTAWVDPDRYGFNELIDYTEADLSQINYQDLYAAAAESTKMIKLDPESRCAILIATEEHQRLADFYITAKKAAAEPARDIRSYVNREQAMEWLTTPYRRTS